MVHNHDHAGVKWGGGARGGQKIFGGAKLGSPPLVAPLAVSYKYKKTNSVNLVQSSLKSHPSLC